MTLPHMILVALGGAAGSVLRFVIAARLNAALPYGTLTVNILGSLLMGLLMGWLLREPRGWLYALLAVGFLGGLTTFSSFAFDLWKLIQAQNLLLASVYLLLSVVGSVIALAVGMVLMRYL